MKITLINETFFVDDGTYSAVITDLFEYADDKLCMKLELDDKTILVKFYNLKELGAYPWSDVFRALDSTDTDDLIGQNVEITVVNTTSKKTGKEFCNIKKVKLI